ncbi:HAD-like domain-containing protein [Syncephalastrum racemosum]|uniref:HAD-like domain-containing protein n=1 Tax=Syncephalastrum racemosum TaxID=13706 RepID=A0A1X2HTJ6_SYNRA|nr:HAD-like domain-containing protein [Syncephalastrum racemosum]
MGIAVCRERIRQTFSHVFKNQMDRVPFYGRHIGMHPRHWWHELVYETFRQSGVPKSELDPKFEELFEALYHRFTSDKGYAAFHDVVPTLTRLQAEGFRMAVISNSDERLTQVLECLELARYFDFVLTSYDEGAEKPSAKIFEAASRRAGISAEEALHVGDDAVKDYRGARHAGWNAVLLDRGRLSYEDVGPLASTRAPEMIKALHDLPRYMDQHLPSPMFDKGFG